MSDDIRILMCGSRTWRDAAPIYHEMQRLIARYGDALIIIHGDEPNGADARICRVCEVFTVCHEMYCAARPRYAGHDKFKIEQVSDWNKDGLSAGPKRNAHMLSTGICGVVAFRMAGVSRGTDGMCDLARAASKPIIVIGI